MYSTNCTLLNTGGHTCSTQSHNCTLWHTIPEEVLAVQHYLTLHSCIQKVVNAVHHHPTVHPAMLEAVPVVQYHQVYSSAYWKQYVRYFIHQPVLYNASDSTRDTAPVRRVAFQKLHSTVFLFNLLFHSLPFSLSLCIFSKAVYRVGSTSG